VFPEWQEVGSRKSTDENDHSQTEQGEEIATTSA
jgi:hypothetical protein